MQVVPRVRKAYRVVAILFLVAGLAFVWISPAEWYEWLLMFGVLGAVCVYSSDALWHHDLLQFLVVAVVMLSLIWISGPSSVDRFAIGVTTVFWIYSLGMLHFVSAKQARVPWWARSQIMRAAYAWIARRDVTLLGRKVRMFREVTYFLPLLGVAVVII